MSLFILGEMRTALAITLTLAIFAAPARGEEPRVPEQPVEAGFWSRQIDGLKLTPMPPGQRWWEVVARDLGCPTYQDGCRTCTSGDCSPVPIACAPAEWKCVAPGK